jgi:hypothetical protein
MKQQCSDPQKLHRATALTLFFLTGCKTLGLRAAGVLFCSSQIFEVPPQSYFCPATVAANDIGIRQEARNQSCGPTFQADYGYFHRS